MKKILTLIILFAILALSCKRPPLAFDRTPFLGNELRTDGFYYYTYYPNSQWDTTNRTYVFFLYKDGTILRGYTYNTVNIQDITIEMIKEDENFYKRTVVHGDCLLLRTGIYIGVFGIMDQIFTLMFH